MSAARRRRAHSASGTFGRYGDVDQAVRAIVASVERRPAPRRVPLGADPFDRIRTALTKRIADLDAQRDLALLADGEPWNRSPTANPKRRNAGERTGNVRERSCIRAM